MTNASKTEQCTITSPAPYCDGGVDAGTQLRADEEQCEALFASGLQRSDAPTAQAVAEAIKVSVRKFGIGGCASLMAQEFGDHPEAAAERMRWVRQLLAEAPAGLGQPPRTRCCESDAASDRCAA